MHSLYLWKPNKFTIRKNLLQEGNLIRTVFKIHLSFQQTRCMTNELV